MDIHLTWLDRINSVLSSSPFNPGGTLSHLPPHVHGYSKSQTEHTGQLVNQKAGRKNVKQHHRSTGQMRINTNDIWFPPPQPSDLPRNVWNWSDVKTERAPRPRHEVKLTFMKLKSQVGLLLRYGFTRRRCSDLLPTSRALTPSPPPMPERNGMLGNITTALYSGLQ